MTLLDDWMPVSDVSARHAIHVAADAERTYRIAREERLGGPLIWLLMGLRGIPVLVARILAGARQPAVSRAGLTVRAGIPFTVLAEEPGTEILFGLRGRFWTPTGGLVAADAATFRATPSAGLAHALWNFRIEPHTNGCRVTTETRVLCADAATRGSFLRYWRVVRFGSGLIRRSMLREIRRRAESAGDYPLTE